MELSKNGSGTITHEGCTIRQTPAGWNVACGNTVIGTKDTLGECETLISEHKQKVRVALANVQRQRDSVNDSMRQRIEDENYTDMRMREGEMGISEHD